MPEQIDVPTLRPQYKLDRNEIASLVEGATGQKPKDGFHSVTLTMQMDGEAGMLTWVDAANRVKPVAASTKPIPRVDPNVKNNKPANS